MGHDKDDEKKAKKNGRGPVIDGPGAEETNAEFGERLLARIAERGGDAFSMAYELTRLSANSGSTDGRGLASTFAQLFALFEFGRPPARDKSKE